MKKIRVFLLQDIIPNYRVPFFQRLSKLKNVDLTVFYSDPKRIFRLKNLKNSENINGFKSIKLPLFETKNKSYQFSFIKYLILKRPDVLISGKQVSLDGLLFLFCCKFLSIKFLWWSGGVPYIDKKIQSMKEMGRIEKIFRKYSPKRILTFKVDGMILYSKKGKKYYSMLGFPQKAIFVAPNSPDTVTLLKYKKKLDENPQIIHKLKNKYACNGEKVIVFLGRLNKERKLDLMIKTLGIVQKKYPLMTCIIIGDGSERLILEKMVINSNLSNFHFLGAIYDEEVISNYFSICDICITPLASITIQMAMIFGKPVISGDFGLEVNVIHDGKNGFIVKIDNLNMVAEKILLLLNNDSLREKMGQSAKDTVAKRIHIHKMIHGFEEAIHFVSKKACGDFQ